MFYKWLLAFKKPSNQLWVTSTYWTIVTVIFVFSLRLGARTLKADILPDITQETLDSLLNVVASSMLAVSTFSLSIMVSAFAAAANSATPRAIDLVMDDRSTRTAISSFICAFIYAIIAKTALGMGFYEQNGRFVLFISTVAVLVYLIVTLIRWVYTLSQLGRLGNTLTKIHHAAEGVESYAKAVAELAKACGIKMSLREQGVDEQAFLAARKELALLAFEDQCTPANPRLAMVEDMEAILTKAYYGE